MFDNREHPFSTTCLFVLNFLYAFNKLNISYFLEATITEISYSLYTSEERAYDKFAIIFGSVTNYGRRTNSIILV